MDNVTSFIEAYKGKEIEEILSHPTLEDDIKALKIALPKLEDPKITADAKALLNNILEALDVYMVSLTHDISNATQNLQTSQKTSRACIAYLTTAQGRKA